MSQAIQVTKRNGSKEPLDLEKFHRVVSWACEGIKGVSASEIEIKSHVQFYNDIKTSDVQETLIKAAAELITQETPNYQYVAGRLVNYHIRKQVFGGYEPVDLYTHVKRVTEEGFYTPELLNQYSEEEFNELDKTINHDRDGLFAYAGIEQFRSKYLVQNRTTGKLYETPQIAYMLIAATLFSQYEDKEERMTYVKEAYNQFSLFNVSLPTPIMAGARTTQKQFSSCVLIETDDSINSINATAGSIVNYVSRKAGIGIGAGRIRAIGSKIRNGEVTHTGVVPFFKYFQAAVKSVNQGGVRAGAATLNYPIWHLEVEDMLVLKNNKGVEDNRVRHLDYCVQFNKLMYERLLTGGNITLFSPADVPKMYDAFFNDQELFKELYEKAERKTSIRKKVIPAIDLFSMFMQERKETGRIYLQNVDHCNIGGSFVEEVAPIRMTNLCVTGDTKVDVLVDGNNRYDISIKEAIDMLPHHEIEVLSKDLESGVKSYKRIADGAMTARNAELMEIEDESTGKIVRCTPDHKIFTSNRGWVMAKELVEDDVLDII